MRIFLKNNKYLLIFSFFIFLFCFVFFTNIHPLVISDTDDWTYIAEARKAIPLWGSWNPAKVFPEMLFPIIGSISMYLIYPITNNFFGAFTISSSFLVSIFITIYCFLFVKLIISKFKFNHLTGISFGIVFFLLHFLFLVKAGNENSYLFWGHDLNCYYNYLIPNILCFFIIFMFDLYNIDCSIKFPKTIKYGALFLILYLAIFSNLYCSIILALYVFFVLVNNVFDNIKKFNLKKFFSNNFLLIIIIFSWIVSAVFEYFGERAKYSSNVSLLSNIKYCLKNLVLYIIHHINHYFLIFIIISFIVFVILFFRDKNKTKYKFVFYYFGSCIIIAVYLILLCSKVDPKYIIRTDCMFGFYEYLLLTFTFCWCYIIKRYNKLLILIPFVIAFSIVEVNCSIAFLPESNENNLNPSIYNSINNDIMDIVLEEVKKGNDNIYVHVPKFSTGDNWPYTTYMGDRINNSLLKSHIIYYPVNITIIPDEDLNLKYNIK